MRVLLRTAPFRKTVARLALVAVVLLASAPTISRWVASGAFPASPELIGICTVSGLEYVGASTVNGQSVPGRGKAPAPQRDPVGMGMDCAYCPLLATTALPPAALALPLPPALANRVPMWRPDPRKASPRFPGRGSRGPPLAL